MEVETGVWFNAPMATEGYGRRGGLLRRTLFVLLALFVLLLLYTLLPFGTQRVVLLGSDARAGEASRSDTIVVAKAGGGMLAVPRDTLVEVPGVGQDKVNAAFAYGGPELTVRTLEGLTGLEIGDYLVLDFGGTEEIVDALGGVTVEVERPIETEQDGEFFSIPAGTQRLNGPQALAYVRYRDDVTADIGRVGRQQRFLLALAGEASSPGNLPRLPATARAAWHNVETSMNPLEAILFAARFALMGGETAQVYPGTPQYINGVSYWVPDPQYGPRVVEATVG